MTGIEKKVRLMVLQEDINHLDSQIAAIQEDRDGPMRGADGHRMERASWYLQEARKQLLGVSLSENPQDFGSILQSSIDGSVRARRRCEFIGADQNNNAG